MLVDLILVNVGMTLRIYAVSVARNLGRHSEVAAPSPSGMGGVRGLERSGPPGTAGNGRAARLERSERQHASTGGPVRPDVSLFATVGH